MDTLNSAVDFAASLRTKASPNSKLPDALHQDPNFVEDAEAAPLIEFSIKSRKNLFMVGPTGCGKSSLAINVAARLNERLEIFNCSGETSTDELIGKPWRKANGEMATIHGAAIRAYEQGKGLLLEEVDHANPDILSVLHRIMELNHNFYVLNVGDSEVITKHKDFFVMATANTIGTGESSYLFAGTKPLNAAFMNRFSYTIKLNYLPAAQEVKVLMHKTGIDQITAEQLVGTANDARVSTTAVSDSIITQVSTRDLLEWADLIVRAKVDVIKAAHYSFLNRANENDREILVRFVENRCS